MRVVWFMRTVTAATHWNRRCFVADLLWIGLVVLILVPNVMAQEAPNGGAEEPAAQSAADNSDAENSDADNSDAETEAARRAFKSDVLEWVDELDSPTLRVRKEAERSLIEAGPKALDHLPKNRVGISLEVAERLERVKKALVASRTKDEIETKSIQIRLDKVSNLGEALEAISRGSGVEFEHNADVAIPVNPVVTPLSFWHAVDLVLDQAKLDVNFYGGDSETLRLDPRAAERPSRVDSAAYVGVYRIEATSVASRRNLRQADLSGLNIGIEISWAPSLTPIGLTIPVAQLSGKLDDGAVLKPQDSGETIDVATNSEIAFTELYLPMKLPAGQPSRIESLSGELKALLPGEKKMFEISLAEPNGKKKIDAMTVQLEEVRRNGPLHEVRVAVELDQAGRSLESHRYWIFENQVFIRRKDGSKAQHLGFEVYRQTESGVGIGYLFDLGDAANDSTLVYQSPTSVIPNEVPFVIQDIPLP